MPATDRAIDRAALRDRLAAPCARPARSRCRPSAVRSRAGPRARRFAGHRSRHRGRRIAARAAAARCPTPAGCRRKPRTIRARLGSAPASGSSIRSTAPAPIIAGRADWAISVALVEDGRPVVAALYAPVDRRTVPRRRRPRRDAATACRSRASDGSSARRRADRRAQALARTAQRHRARHAPRRRKSHSLALRLARVAARRARCRFRLRPTATTGTLRQPTFWCTKPAALMTDFDGAVADLQPARIRCTARCSPPGARVMRRCSTSCATGRPNSRNSTVQVCVPLAPGPARTIMSDQAHSEAVAASRHRRRTDPSRRTRIQGSRQGRYRRRLPELRHRLCRLEGEGAADRRQRPDALLHRASAPPARSRRRPAEPAR